MRSPIVLFSRVNPQTGDLEVNDEAFIKTLGVNPEDLMELLPDLKKHTIVLKEKWEQSMQDVVDTIERAAPQRRKGAMVEQYVQEWTEPGQPCEATFRALHPNLADKLGYALEQRIFPSLMGDADFLSALQTLRARLTASAPEATSTPSSSASETCIQE